jgi:hypothetical protein
MEEKEEIITNARKRKKRKISLDKIEIDNNRLKEIYEKRRIS